MRDDDKTKTELMAELAQLRRRITTLETELAHRELPYRLLFEQAGVGLGFYTPAGVLISFNAVALKHMAGRLEDFVGKSTEEIFGPDLGATVLDRIRRAVETKTDHEYEHFVTLPTGQKWFLSHFTPISDPQGQIIGVEVLSYEITRQKQMAAELKNRNQFIETILDNLPIGLGVNYIDAGKIIYMNPQFEKIYGWPRDKISDIGAFFTCVFPDPEYRQEVQRQVLADLEFGDPEQMRWEGIEVTQQDGSHRIIAAKNIPLVEQNLMIATVQDMTERKQTEDALHLSNRRLQILRQIDQAILTAQSPLETIHAVLPRFAQLVACQSVHVSLYNPEQQLFENVATYPPQIFDLQLIQRIPVNQTFMDLEALRAGKIHHVEDYQAIANLPPRIARILAQARLRSALVAPLLLEQELLGLFGVGRQEPGEFATTEIEMVREVADLLAIAIQQARLLEREREARRIAEVLNAANAALSRTMELEQVLDSMLAYLEQLVPYDSACVMLREGEQQVAVHALRGYERWTDPEKTRQVTLEIDPQTTPLLYKLFADKTSVVRADTRQDPYWEPDQGEHVRNWMGIPLVAGNAVIGLYSVDKTEPDFFTPDHMRLAESLAAHAAAAVQNARLYQQTQQHTEELARRVAERTAELSAANAQLARATRLKDEFLANMSHELRTPLNAILGMAEILHSSVYGPLNEEQLKAAMFIEESGQHLLALITDILDLSKIEAGELQLQLDPVDVAELCEASLRFVSRKAHQKQIQMFSSIETNITTFMADERRLKQILVNLLSNAVKFTPVGGQIGLEVTGDASQSILHFTVWDTGIGIEPQHFERLFKPFVQIDNRLSRQHEGTGLGLALVSRLAELHDGRVSLTSSVGQGSRFTVSLPWQAPQQLADGADDASRESEQEPWAPKTINGQTVLLAEDNEANIAVFYDFLQSSGYRVLIARDGEEAISRAVAEKPDIILMDVQMPTIDGLEATRQLRAMPQFANTPIIGLTALAMPGDQEQCLAAGMNDFLSKPVSLKRLRQMIETYLQTASGQSGK